MNKIINLLLPLFLLVLGFQFAKDYFVDSSKEERINLQQLIDNGQEAVGVLDAQYTEKTVKIAKIPIKTYEVGYTFKVEETEYKGTETLQEPPTIPMLAIKYLPSNPLINRADPVGKLASLNENKDSSSPLFIGLGLMLAGLGLGYFRYKPFLKNKAA